MYTARSQTIFLLPNISEVGSMCCFYDIGIQPAQKFAFTDISLILKWMDNKNLRNFETIWKTVKVGSNNLR